MLETAATAALPPRPVATRSEAEQLARSIINSYGDLTRAACAEFRSQIEADPRLLLDVLGADELEQCCARFLRRIHLHEAARTMRRAQVASPPQRKQDQDIAGPAAATRVELGLLEELRIGDKPLAACTRLEVEGEQKRLTRHAKFYRALLDAMPRRANAVVGEHVSAFRAQALMAGVRG